MTDAEAILAIRRLPRLWAVDLRWFHGTKPGQWYAKIHAWKEGQYGLDKDWYTISSHGSTIGAAVDQMLGRVKCHFCKTPRALKARETSKGKLRTCGSCARKPLGVLEAKLFTRQARRGP